MLYWMPPPAGLQSQIIGAIGQMDGVLDVERVRVRRAGNRHFVDATVSVPRTTSLEQVHLLTDAIEKTYRRHRTGGRDRCTRSRAPRKASIFLSRSAPWPSAWAWPFTISRRFSRTAVFSSNSIWKWMKILACRDAHRRATELEEGIHPYAMAMPR